MTRGAGLARDAPTKEGLYVAPGFNPGLSVRHHPETVSTVSRSLGKVPAPWRRTAHGVDMRPILRFALCILNCHLWIPACAGMTVVRTTTPGTWHLARGTINSPKTSTCPTPSYSPA